MKIFYLKMQGTGNEILVVDERRDSRPPPAAQRIRELAAATNVPDFDQLMWVTADDEHAAAYRVFNADGSEAEQCGNGVRCVAAMLAATEDHAREFSLLCPAGIVRAHVGDDGRVAVDMGPPEFEPARIPFAAEARAPRYRLEAGGATFAVCAVSMGNPHCVLQVDDLTGTAVDALGPLLECHPRFPEKANVGFARIVDRRHIELRVYERGVGETAACGTGACAAVTALQQLGLLDNEVTVHLPGGQVVVSWAGGAEPAWLTGNAEFIAEGFIDL